MSLRDFSSRNTHIQHICFMGNRIHGDRQKGENPGVITIYKE